MTYQFSYTYKRGRALSEAEIQQAAADAAELAEAKKAVVNFYLDGNTGEIVTVCHNCFVGNEAEMKDLSYIDKAGDWDICGCCGVAQNIPADYHGEI